MKCFFVTCMLAATMAVISTSCGSGENKDSNADSSMNAPAAPDTSVQPSGTMGGQNLDSSHFQDTTPPKLRDTMRH